MGSPVLDEVVAPIDLYSGLFSYMHTHEGDLGSHHLAPQATVLQAHPNLPVLGEWCPYILSDVQV